MRQWGDTHAAPQGPPMLLTHDDHTCTTVLVCEHCSERIGPRDVRVTPGPGAGHDGLPA